MYVVLLMNLGISSVSLFVVYNHFMHLKHHIDTVLGGRNKKLYNTRTYKHHGLYNNNKCCVEWYYLFYEL